MPSDAEFRRVAGLPGEAEPELKPEEGTLFDDRPLGAPRIDPDDLTRPPF